MVRTQRTEQLIGAEGVNTLAAASVLIVGLGGVGGCVFEMLARAGIGHLTVVDGDVFDESNLNRQILSESANIGKPKAAAAAARAERIAPACSVTALCMRYSAETADTILHPSFDYVADCIDSVADKTDLIVRCSRRGIPVISAMGAGNRLTPKFCITDIYDTTDDGLARVMRKKLRAAGIASLLTVCDAAPPLCSVSGAPGSISYAPNLSGCLMAQKIITDLLWNE